MATCRALREGAEIALRPYLKENLRELLVRPCYMEDGQSHLAQTFWNELVLI